MSSLEKKKEKLHLRDLGSKLIELGRQENLRQGMIGKVIVSKLRMMKHPEEHSGYLKVFPNYKHQNRGDGFGCMSLSPMSLGPVDHGQPELPMAKNIENFHQGSKCFKEETDEEGNPSAVYKQNRQEFYKDKTPHRHKYMGLDKKNRNIPLYFVWIDMDKKEHHLSYFECRQFYCTFYERLASKQEDFLKLQELIWNGTNIQICGYDGRSIEDRSIEEEYFDGSKPFGHELVLATMLREKPENYPWRKYKKFDF